MDGTGRTVLHNVVLHDTPELTKLFLKHIGPNVVTAQLVTPLHEAAVRGSLRSAKILLDAGAEVCASVKGCFLFLPVCVAGESSGVARAVAAAQCDKFCPERH